MNQKTKQSLPIYHSKILKVKYQNKVKSKNLRVWTLWFTFTILALEPLNAIAQNNSIGANSSNSDIGAFGFTNSNSSAIANNQSESSNSVTPNDKTGTALPENHTSEFLEEFPHLTQQIYLPPRSPFLFSLSLGLLGLLKDRMLFTLNFFQLHHMSDNWDHELLSVSYGSTTTKPSYIQSHHFTFRTSPKWRVINAVSIGPLLGYEYVSFPQIQAQLRKGIYQTDLVSFSTKGAIYGLMVSENIKLDSGSIVRVSQMAYKQTYSTTKGEHDWSYNYEISSLRKDTTPIEGGTVLLLELGIMF
jgi:hypothetical protein